MNYEGNKTIKVIMTGETITVSIITPLYKGIKFLPNLQNMIKECAGLAKHYTSVEWVISNDFPGETIDITEDTDDLRIIVLNTDKNRGIQGARIRGLEASSGEYILFLDQDDVIDPNWIASQVKCIGDADGSVCDCHFDGAPFYNGWDRPTLEECITKEYNICEKNGFVPGQVLIRRSSIPVIWKENWLNYNACDDQLLWLCMFGNGAVFVPNKGTCYHHKVSGNNQSKNLPERYMSNKEMIDLLAFNHVLSKNDIDKLTRSREKETIKYLRQNYAQKKKISIYEQILRCYESSDSTLINEELDLHQGIGIYGINLGIHIYKLLNGNGITVNCFIDRNKTKEGLPIPIVEKTAIPNCINTVINTLIMDEEEINDYLHVNYPNICVVSIQELFKGWQD